MGRIQGGGNCRIFGPPRFISVYVFIITSALKRLIEPILNSASISSVRYVHDELNTGHCPLYMED